MPGRVRWPAEVGLEQLQLEPSWLGVRRKKTYYFCKYFFLYDLLASPSFSCKWKFINHLKRLVEPDTEGKGRSR
jgi:hypothetical protein